VGFVVGWDNHTNCKRPTLWLWHATPLRFVPS
jgi:hypothetical protein